MIYHNPAWARTSVATPIELYGSPAATPLPHLVLFIGGTHGDEPLGVRLAGDFLSWLKTQDNLKPWLLIPCINPDGVAKQTRVNARGVDLNRNYPSSDWGETFEKPRYYPGPSAGSEPEIQALVKLILDIKPELIVHFHSWKPCLVATGAPAEQHAQALSTCSGYPIVPTIGYETPGSLSQFAWVDHQIPVICIEESDDALPESTWPRFAEGLKALVTRGAS